MRQRKVRIVSFASSEQTSTLEKVFARLEYDLEIISPNDWISQVSFDARVIDIFFLAGDFSVECCEQCLSALHRCRSLVIFNNEATTGIEKLVELADEFVLWPCNEEELVFRLSRLSEEAAHESSDAPYLQLQEEFLKVNLIGQSDAFNQVLQFIKKVACYEVPILIEGETGTGKEMVARAVHYLGQRKNQAFVPVNCGSLPDNLVENELFGHQRGAYTDAKADHAGLVTLADGGTLFLDEVETLSEKGQVTLLRFLQDKDFKPLGAKHTRKADVRVITATNQPLAKLVEQGYFRQDLFFRLNVLSVELPPLRDRRGDVDILTHYFVDKFRKRYDQVEKFIPPQVMRLMRRYEWPGNVRELENVVHRSFLLSDSPVLQVDQQLSIQVERRNNFIDRRFSIDTGLSFQDAKNKVIEEFENRYLRMLMQQTGGHITRAAEMAGKERSALGKLLKKYDIRRDDFVGA